MDRVTLLDTSVGTTNLGDEIIMRCFREEMKEMLEKYFVLTAPTHLRSFSVMQNIGSLPDSAREIANSKYKFVCGTNLLSSNLFHRSNQWDLSLLTCKPFRGSILVGVGGNTFTNRGLSGAYTKAIYQKVLSKDYIHSVRTEQAEESLKKLGFKALNTGCLTLWNLSSDFCGEIHRKKGDVAVVSLTDYNRDPQSDKLLIDIVRKNYENVFFMPQGIYDRDYLLSIDAGGGIVQLPPSIDSYERLLKSGKTIDYIGTRFHGGIFAMRHKARCIVVTLDERMAAMQSSIANNCLPRSKVKLDLEDKINSEFSTKVNVNFSAIKEWKAQFD